MINASVSKVLYEMANLLELDEGNPFRIRAFQRAAQTLESYSSDLATLNREQLMTIPGVGQGIADMILEYVQKGAMFEHERLKKKFPPGVLQMMTLPGLGPKRAGLLFKQLKIESIDKLKQAASKGTLRKIRGFGEKTELNIIKNIAFYETASQRTLVTEALKMASELEEYLRQAGSIEKIELAGSARRWKETVGDLDFLCVSRAPEKAIDHFRKFLQVDRTLAAGSTKASVVLKNGMQVDLRVVDANSFGATLLYFTGSKEHNVRLRELALKKGYTLNEYGLYSLKNKKKPVASRTEEDVYRALGLAWIPPEIREDRGEIEAGLNNSLPKLVSEKEVLGDFHNHTKESDGSNSLEEMLEAAQERGWKWFFSADHSPSLKIASGLSVDALRRKIGRIKKLDQANKKIRVFSSSEVDILADGHLDYPDDMLRELDCVVASVHTRFNQSEEEMTERICRALKNPHTDILGHISGRLINRREPYSVNYETVLQTAKETQTAIEINGQPQRQELSDAHVKRAIELGVPLALNTDAHSIFELNNMTLAIHIARRGWAEPRHLLNTCPADEILQWLKN